MSNDKRALPTAGGSSAGNIAPANPYTSTADAYQHLVALRNNSSQRSQIVQQQQAPSGNHIALAQQQHLQRIAREGQLNMTHHFPQPLHSSILGLNAPYPRHNMIQNQSIPRSEGQRSQNEAADPSWNQPNSFHFNDVLNDYTHLNSLIAEQRLLLNAHIAEVAYQQALLERQLAIENEMKGVDSLLLRERERSLEEAQLRKELRDGVFSQQQRQQQQQQMGESIDDGNNQSLTIQQTATDAQNTSVASLIGAGLHIFPMRPTENSSLKQHDGNTKKLSAEKKCAPQTKQKSHEDGLLLNTTATLCNASLSRGAAPSQKWLNFDSSNQAQGVRRKAQSPPRNPPAAHKNIRTMAAQPLPQSYKKFIDAIFSNPQAQTIVDHFHKQIRADTDSSLAKAVSEDKGQIQHNSEAKQQYYNEQLETMKKRLDMYTQLEELIDQILAEQSTSGQSKNSRISSRANVREITMDLIHMGLNNYQLLEDNMDMIVNESLGE